LALGRRFQGILAWDSFFHLSCDDQRAMFGVFAARAAEGALLMFNAGAAKGDAIGSYRGDPLYHSSLDPSDYQALLAGAGFALIGNFTGDFARGGRASWLARAAHAARWP
jgi:hypothetical protein